MLGDVIYIEASSGNVKRVGRSDTYASEYDLEAEEYVPLPKGIFFFLATLHYIIIKILICYKVK